MSDNPDDAGISELEYSELMIEIRQKDAEIERLRTALKQIAIDCGKVLDDEICSHAERRAWKALGRFALHVGKDRPTPEGGRP